MAATPTTTQTWTVLASTNPTIGPSIAWVATSNGTLYCVPGAPGTLLFVASGAEPAGTTVTWTALVSASLTNAASVAWVSIGSTAALYYGAGSLSYAAGA